MSNCRSCGASIEWAVVGGTGKRMPLDVLPDEPGSGNVRPIGRFDDAGRTLLVEVVKAGEGNRVSHFATCPNAGQHRKPRE